MKKILLPVFALGAILTVKAQLYVGDGGLVHVEPKTNLYSKGGLEAEAATATSTVVQFENEGWVTLEGPVKNNVTSGVNMKFQYQDNSLGATPATNTVFSNNVDVNYGQLKIISSASPSDGVITMSSPVFLRQDAAIEVPEISLPFKAGESVQTALEALGIEFETWSGASNAYQSGTYRYKRYGWTYNNTKHQFDNSPSTIEPFKAYSINFYAGGFSPFKLSTQPKASKDFVGKPNSASATVMLQAEERDLRKTATSQIVNDYREQLNTYLPDLSAGVTDLNWGHNIFQLPNPYTANLSVAKLLNKAGITPADVDFIAVPYKNNDTGNEVNNTNEWVTVGYSYYIATVSGTSFASTTTYSASGSPENLIVRPFGVFWVKLKDGSANKTITFDDTSVVFDTNPGLPSLKDNSAYSRVGSTTSYVVNNNTQVEDLRFALKQNDKILDNVFIGANPYATSEYDTKLDAVGSGTGKVVVLSEDPADANRALKLNGFNMKTYVKRPINVKVSTTPGQTYSIGADVRIGADVNVDNTKFYIEDKVTKQIMKVGSDFNYNFKASDNDTSRFVVYYGGVPVTTSEVVATATQNIMDVAKNELGTNFVVFKGLTGKAKVYVYNVLGQLVYSDENVSMDQNYPLSKLPSVAGVYVVKVVTDAGKTVTKKIVK